MASQNELNLLTRADAPLVLSQNERTAGGTTIIGKTSQASTTWPAKVQIYSGYSTR